MAVIEADAYTVKLSARLPDGEANGLAREAESLCQYPHKRRWAIVELETAKIVADVNEHADTAVLAIVRVVLLSDVRARQAQAMLVAEPNGGPHLFTDPDTDPDALDAPDTVSDS